MVRVRYSFSSRRTGHIENIRKQKKKFPALAREVVDNSDIVLEILDARFINETRNLEIEEYIKKKNKRIIFVLNKADLAENINKDLLAELYPYVLVSAKTRKGAKDLRKRIKIESKKIETPLSDLGKVSIGVVGYPNTGKSSLINMLIGKHSARTAPEAGFTKGLQKLNLTPEIQLIDSPGIIPEKEYSNILTEKISKHAKVGGRSYNQVRDPEMVIAAIIKEHKGVLESHYNIKADGNSEILIEELGKRHGFLKKGGIVDEDRTARLILKDWQEGKIKV
jgi:ribosome biogenesis GTPase A